MNRGFSILETVIYIAILAVILVVVINTTLLVSNAFGKARVNRNVATQGSAAFERLLREIRLADDVLEAESIFGVSPGRLKLSTIVSPDDEIATTREFFIDSQTSSLMIAEGVSPAIALTSGIQVTDLVFYNISSSATTSQAVRAEMTIENTFKQSNISRNFYGTAVLRRSY